MPPKMARGENRVVDRDRSTIGVLMAHQIPQADARAVWGDAYDDHGLVFALEDGSPPPPSRATEAFSKLTKGGGTAQDQAARPTARTGVAHVGGGCADGCGV